jgi:hypothetical protein
VHVSTDIGHLCCSSPCDFLPNLEALEHLLAVLAGRKQVASRAEVLGDEAKRRQETLGVPRGFEPLHALLPLARGLVRVLGAVVQISVLPMFHPRQNLSLGGPVALQPIGDEPRGTYWHPLRSLRKNFLAAFLSRRRWTRISSTVPS